MSKTMSFGLLCRLSVASAALMGLAGLAGVAHADKVGVAAAVNPDAFSSLSGAPQSQLNIGKSIFYNERIRPAAIPISPSSGSSITTEPPATLPRAA
jgi:hypothetical protein